MISKCKTKLPLQFNFTDFRLENSIHHDYVRILNGPYSSSPELGRFTGTTLPTAVGPTMTNAMMIYFLTEESGTAAGFRLVAREHTAGNGPSFGFNGHGLGLNNEDSRAMYKMNCNNFPHYCFYNLLIIFTG